MNLLSSLNCHMSGVKYFVSLLFIFLTIMIFYQTFFVMKNIETKIIPAESLLHSGEVHAARFLKGGWQQFLKKEYDLFVHKSFIDLRLMPHRENAVIVTTALLRGTKIFNFTAICKVKINGKWLSSKARLGAMPNSWRREYTGWQSIRIICPISRTGPYPSQLILFEENTLEEVFLPVELAVSGNYKLATCVPIVYGDFDSESLIEWFELQKQFGVEKISMHIWKVSEENWRVFSHYKVEGILDFYELDTPYNFTYAFEKSKMRSPKKPYLLEALYSVDLLECLLRNYLRSEYIMVMDLDEVLVPKNFNNYHEFLNHYKQYDTVRFPMVNFDITCNLTIPHEEHQFFKRAFREIPKPYKLQLPLKSIHKSKSCVMFLQHNCVLFADRVKHKSTTIDYNEMMLRHYRKRGRCESSTRFFIEDKSLNKFSGLLAKKLQNIKKMLLS